MKKLVLFLIASLLVVVTCAVPVGATGLGVPALRFTVCASGCDFTSGTTFVCSGRGILEVTACGGGGGAGAGALGTTTSGLAAGNAGGGGGGGGCSPSTRAVFCTAGDTITITLGAGGAGGASSNLSGSGGGSTTIVDTTTSTTLATWVGGAGGAGGITFSGSPNTLQYAIGGRTTPFSPNFVNSSYPPATGEGGMGGPTLAQNGASALTGDGFQLIAQPGANSAFIPASALFGSFSNSGGSTGGGIAAGSGSFEGGSAGGGGGGGFAGNGGGGSPGGAAGTTTGTAGFAGSAATGYGAGGGGGGGGGSAGTTPGAGGTGGAGSPAAALVILDPRSFL